MDTQFDKGLATRKQVIGQHELKGHVRAALNNGATVQEIQELLLHATIYCGVPAAVDVFRSAAEVIDRPERL